MATISLFQTPQNEPQEDSVCSQDLFGSPEIVATPTAPAISHFPNELDQCMEQSDWNNKIMSSEMLSVTPTLLSQPLVHSTPFHPTLPSLKQGKYIVTMCVCVCVIYFASFVDFFLLAKQKRVQNLMCRKMYSFCSIAKVSFSWAKYSSVVIIMLYQ